MLSFRTRLKKDLKKNGFLYVMIIPVLLYFIVYHYWPMYGVMIAFKDYKVKMGILGSPFVGLKHFERFFSSYYFELLLKNTLSVSAYSLLVEFPIPIIFALLLHYLKNNRLRKVTQMVSYAPHFISTVVICSMITIFSSKDTDLFNIIRGFFGLEAVNFLSKPEWFKSIYVWSGVWQSAGWSAIIYISALAGVDYELHEAAIMDGATKIKRMIYIDLPSIKPTIIMLLIMRLGSMMSIGFEKVYLMQNDLNKSASAIISTYVYEQGLVNQNYSFSTAVGLFNSAVNLLLLVSANTISKKLMNESLY